MIMAKDEPNIPIRILECGHERAEDVRSELREDLIRRGLSKKEAEHDIPYQKVGDKAYCRLCNEEKTIERIKV
jgi:hypothetical protein